MYISPFIDTHLISFETIVLNEYTIRLPPLLSSSSSIANPQPDTHPHTSLPLSLP
ncbi:hypothetical protein HanRHA438_Chr07g0310201 [Helianthus annuus]|uniref:Uncharacterized protein n=1 Tax=Helianthus annuus TaxID=4232 RepID=A0A251UBN8_HELAN|nr:hypothetical protein HanXRQr2_Chr07g0299901 [Helianthus annuus]KAJ0563498.1 hypothetical protein HanHA89_Chr07g0263851 [Helianthus annuus]KAJ0731594.1 hypothetical protein HanOQP8_Chr07g0253791 [Helianthus annuus]KAJ0908416.1 hypothetical protein HanRHA438_Chr07g0310201 [Helianthus annuus]